MLEPYYNYVLIEEQKAENNVGGFVITDTKSNYREGKLVKAGKLLSADGSTLEFPFELGCTVVYTQDDKQYTKIIDGKNYRLIHATSIVGATL